MLKKLLIPLIAILAISCSQTKEVTSVQPDAEQTHRYKTVYEGNRIIKYDANLDDNQPIPQQDVIAHSVPNVEIRTKRKKVDNLTYDNHAERSGKKFKKKRLSKISSVSDDTESEAGGGWLDQNPGAFGLILYGGAILFFWIPIFAGLLGLAALVFAIIGAVEKNSKRDLVFSWVVIGLFILGFIILILAIAASGVNT